MGILHYETLSLHQTFHFCWLANKAKRLLKRYIPLDSFLSLLFYTISRVFPKSTHQSANSLCICLSVCKVPLENNTALEKFPVLQKRCYHLTPWFCYFFLKSFVKKELLQTKCRWSNLRPLDGFDWEENNSRDSKVF